MMPAAAVEVQAAALLANLARADAFMRATTNALLEASGKKAAGGEAVRFDLSPLNSLTETIREQNDGLLGRLMAPQLAELLAEAIEVHAGTRRRFYSFLEGGRGLDVWNLA